MGKNNLILKKKGTNIQLPEDIYSANTDKYIIENINNLFKNLSTELQDINSIIIISDSNKMKGEKTLVYTYSKIDIPIIRISDERSVGTFSFSGKQGCCWFIAPHLDAWFHPSEIERTSEKIFNFINKYYKLNNITKNKLIDLFNAPNKFDEKNIKKSFPLMEKTPDKKYFWRSWIISRALLTPGLVLDKKRAATRANMKVEAFEKRKNEFEEAKYNGIFSDYLDDRWWMKSLERIVHENKITVKDKNKPKCSICAKLNPQRNARYNHYKDDFSTIVPVHYKCSNITKTTRDPYLNIREVAYEDERTLHKYLN